MTPEEVKQFQEIQQSVLKGLRELWKQNEDIKFMLSQITPRRAGMLKGMKDAEMRVVEELAKDFGGTLEE